MSNNPDISPNIARDIPIVAIDGPSGSGKGTIAQALAMRLKWHYLESGALYRVLGLLAHRNGVALNDVRGLVELARGLDLTFQNGAVFFGDEEIGDAIRTEQAGERASKVAPLPPVRAALLKWQRARARNPGLVADGRDMGSVVFPHAQCKIFLTADAETRAKRRFKQLSEKGFNVNIRQLVEEINERDRRDSNRKISPLRCPADAFELDGSLLSVDEVMAAVAAHVDKCMPGVFG